VQLLGESAFVAHDIEGWAYVRPYFTDAERIAALDDYN
jgi:hypothetical protein